MSRAKRLLETKIWLTKLEIDEATDVATENRLREDLVRMEKLHKKTN